MVKKDYMFYTEFQVINVQGRKKIENHNHNIIIPAGKFTNEC